MIKHGTEPYLECSSAGDKRFSAFFARIRASGDKTIEEIYQAYKVFEDGSTGLSIKEAKGRKPINDVLCRLLYMQLWEQYIYENPHLKVDLMRASGLSDKFGQPKHVCQATELWHIRNKLLREAIFNEYD